MKKAEKLLKKLNEKLSNKQGIEELIDIILVSGGDIADIVDLLAVASSKRSMLMKDHPGNGRESEKWKKASILLSKFYKEISKKI